LKTLRGIWLLGTLAALCCAAPASPQYAPVDPGIPVVLLKDISNGQILYAREAERRFMPASVTKTMTAFTAFELIKEGKIRPSANYVITPELQKEWYANGSNMFLRAGDRPTIGELILGATTVSGNDASVALAMASVGSLESWIDLMNANARKLGMRNTHFGSANGLPDEGRTFTSAQDLSLLAEALVMRHPDLYRRYFGHRTFTWNGITQQNHDPVTGRVHGGDGIKTGFTNEAGNTVVGSAERDGRRLIVVLAGAPDARRRDKSARDLLEWGFSEFTMRVLAEQGSAIGEAKVQNGAATKVPLRAGRVIGFALPEGAAGAVSTSIRYHGPVSAPIAEGDHIADLRVEIDGQPPFDIPLVAAENVAEAGFLMRIFNGFLGFFG
jgi:D-alanyl-D-alanine carboxypeptidase (penicillin-binding protein 5/6)